MLNDPRDKNQYFNRDNIWKYLREYNGAIAYSLNKIDQTYLENAKNILRLTLSRSGRIFVGGNGGSSAIADHLTCDFTKGTFTEKNNCLQVHNLNGSTALFTALANDIGYEKTLSQQLLMAQINSRDCVVLISSSGNSPNIIEAAKIAKQRCADLIGMTGFDGGELRKLCNIELHIPFNNYGVVEDCHQILMHILAQFHFMSSNK